MIKLKPIIAGILIALGIAAFVYQGVTYMTSGRDWNNRFSNGATEHKHEVPLPPILGAIALIGGIALLLVDRQDFKREATP